MPQPVNLYYYSIPIGNMKIDVSFRNILSKFLQRRIFSYVQKVSEKSMSRIQISLLNKNLHI